MKSYQTLFVGSLLTTLLLTYPIGWTETVIAHTQGAHAMILLYIYVKFGLWDEILAQTATNVIFFS